MDVNIFVESEGELLRYYFNYFNPMIIVLSYYCPDRTFDTVIYLKIIRNAG